MANGTGTVVKLRERIADLTELEVQTFTGTIEQTLIASGDGSKALSVLDWEKLVAQAKSETTGTIALAAATSAKFDGDTNLFIAKDVDPDVLEAHNEAVQAAQEVRQALIELFKDILDFRKEG